MSSKPFFDMYFEHIGDTEAPFIFHRWSIITSLAAVLGRRGYISLGHYKIYPNMFSMLVGVSGCRKDSAINISKALLKQAGYKYFSSNKTSKEKFISDLCDRNKKEMETEEGLLLAMENCTIEDSNSKPAECFIALGEFQDFLGQNNLDFITMLGALWDMPDSYEHRIKTGRSPNVDRPTVSVLGGSTPTGFSLIFPPEIVGQGFLSRLLLVYGEPTFKRIAWPKKPKSDPRLVQKIKEIVAMKNDTNFIISPEAVKLITRIYQTNISLEDPRFASYQSRRHIHLLKLCSVLSCMNMGLGEFATVTAQNVLEANTILYYTEQRMPLALGEFGRGKYSEVSNAIMEELSKASTPLGLMDLWKVVGHDLTNIQELAGIMKSLQGTEKVQTVLDKEAGMQKFLANKKRKSYFSKDLLCPDILTEEEMLGSGML